MSISPSSTHFIQFEHSTSTSLSLLCSLVFWKLRLYNIPPLPLGIPCSPLLSPSHWIPTFRPPSGKQCFKKGKFLLGGPTLYPYNATDLLEHSTSPTGTLSQDCANRQLFGNPPPLPSPLHNTPI
eukprot:TRINITY_DN2955_c0_g1_i1.p1 TRINITY_DN2955_c0_g1~~TRINITY_DN2955_c0_g1_i1.p1  ORF type:complete len:125 (-),score=17.33 TRINITY_DN2955_c0_g1_i1:439-813(-)